MASFDWLDEILRVPITDYRLIVSQVATQMRQPIRGVSSNLLLLSCLHCDLQPACCVLCRWVFSMF